MNKPYSKIINWSLSIIIVSISIVLGILIYHKVVPISFNSFQEAINSYTYKELDSIVYNFRTENLENLIENQVNKELDSILYYYTIDLQKKLVPIEVFEDYFYSLSNKYPHLSRIRYDVSANKANLYWIDNERIQKRKEREIHNRRIERDCRIKNIDTVRYKNYYFYRKLT